MTQQCNLLQFFSFNRETNPKAECTCVPCCVKFYTTHSERTIPWHDDVSATFALSPGVQTMTHMGWGPSSHRKAGYNMQLQHNRYGGIEQQARQHIIRILASSQISAEQNESRRCAPLDLFWLEVTGAPRGPFSPGTPIVTFSGLSAQKRIFLIWWVSTT